jgi:membrane protease YdiL (CAAX protease family)
VFAQTFMGGLILGTIYLRAKNIVPGSILHVAGNMYVSRIVEVLSG